MKKKKSRKKLVIGVGVLIVAVVAGVNIYGSMNAVDSAIPQVKTVSAVRDNVQQTVEISGTVVSEEQKTYFSPVNAKVDTAALKEGETVKANVSCCPLRSPEIKFEDSIVRVDKDWVCVSIPILLLKRLYLSSSF